jgi:hypothetical protein
MKAQTYLHYYPDGTQFSRTAVRLSWTDDDRLVLERVDAELNPVDVVFDAPVREVRVTGAMSVPKFTVGGRGHRVDFAESARLTGMITGAIGGAVDSNAARGASVGIYAGGTAASGVAQWIAALRAAGASTSYWTTSKIMAVTVISTIALVAVIAVAIVVVAIVNPSAIYD